MIEMDNDEIWYWYEIVEDFKKKRLSKTVYCKQYNLELKKFCNMYYRCELNRENHPKVYENRLNLTRQWQNSGMSQSKFCEDKDISKSQIGSTVIHLNYLDIIEKIRKERESQSMRFVEIKAPASLVPVENRITNEPEIVDKKNDIEIHICKGVKVSIAPGIEPMKIIKIIELLQEL